MMHRLLRIWCFCSLPALLFGGWGCVAVDVGKPETFRVEVPVGRETRTVAREVVWSQVVAERPDVADSGPGSFPLDVSLKGEVDSMQQMGRLSNEVEVTCQKRLSFGLFPGWAEWLFRPPECARCTDVLFGSGGSVSDGSCSPGAVFPIVTFGAAATPLIPYFLLVEPFAGKWRCSPSSCWTDRDSGKEQRFWQARGDRGFVRVTASMGVGNPAFFLHFVPLGFFRHCYLEFSDERPDGWVPLGAAKHVRKTLAATGPYRVELSIPELGYSDSRIVGEGETKARFAIPVGKVPGNAVALVRFRLAGDAADEAQEALLDDAVKWTQVVPVYLPGKAGVHMAVVEAEIRGAPLRYAKERDGRNGRSSWVVEILDEEKEVFDVAAFVRPLILDELRAGWLELHPAEEAESVGAWADWKTGKNDRTLVFDGAAFSVRPLADGWRYDAATRRGMVRLRVPTDADAESARGWARENVESIARDRAVVLGAGTALPEGARYRSLSERFEGGILTLEFEVVE